jgi:NCS2 family nucleobase:cation symporter-2
MAKGGEDEDDQTIEKNPCGGVYPSYSGICGNYAWGFLCMPNVLGCLRMGKMKPGPFLKKEEQLPLLVMLVMGLQHALAMLGGIITPPKLIAGDACFGWQQDMKLCNEKEYLISAALITSGLLTIIQVIRLKLCCGYALGTGLLSVMGTSFTFLPLARQIVVSEIQRGKSENGGDGTGYGFEAYGKVLGTCIVASGLEVVLSFIHPKLLKKIFPPIVSGTCVTLIGVSLSGTGMKYWGGGVFCAENDMSKSATFGGAQACEGNGEYQQFYGDREYLILGAVVIGFLVFFQIFGSPFLKSTSVFWSLIGGYLYATFFPAVKDGVTYEFVSQNPNKFVEAADWIVYPDPTKFKLGFYLPGLMPLLLAFLVTTIESVGDINASMDATGIPSSGPDADSRVQGGLLADGLNSAIACALSTPPNTTFSQNNGVIAITRCGSRAAGLACAFWLILLGVVGKFGGFIASIPDATLGGMTIFLFANVVVSGISIIGKEKITHRSRFILALALGVGIGVACEPHFAEGGGVASFYGKNLAHNLGPWPKKDVCIEFPTVTTTVHSCEFQLDGEAAAASYNFINEADCATIGGTYSKVDTVSTVETCDGKNGRCCLKYDTDNFSQWALRETVMLSLKTPYCVGTLIAMILNLMLPFEKDDEEEEEEAPKNAA